MWAVSFHCCFVTACVARRPTRDDERGFEKERASEAEGDNLVPQNHDQDQKPRQGQQQSEQVVIRFIREPDPAPEFAVKGIDGGTVNLAAARGKVVLLNFWATWCGPCRMEVPDLVELQKKYSDRLQVIGLVVDDADEDVRKFAQRYDIDYPIAMAPDEMRVQFGGEPALPTSMRGRSRPTIFTCWESRCCAAGCDSSPALTDSIVFCRTKLQSVRCQVPHVAPEIKVTTFDLYLELMIETAVREKLSKVTESGEHKPVIYV